MNSTTPVAPPLLDVQDLRVSFPGYGKPVQAVRGLSFQLGRGECVGLVGESGSGKSVSAWSLAGLLGKDALIEGKTFLEGKEIEHFSPEEKRRIRGTKIAMIFQEPSRSFDPIYSLEKTFLETFRAHDPKAEPDACRQKAIGLLREVHIPEPETRLKSFPHQFSGGMLQRVMIALSLANDPEILICDEPTTALDVTIQAQIISLLKELKARRGLSLIFISHDLDLVASIADRIIVLYGGLLMEEGSTKQVLENPQSPYTRALWDSRIPWGNHYSQNALVQIGGMPPDPANPEPGCPFAPRCTRAKDVCKSAIPALSIDNSDPAAPRRWRCLFPGGFS